MSIHDDPTQAMPAVPPPGKPRWRRWYVITPAALAVGIITISGLGGSHTTAAKAAPARPSAPAKGNATAACHALAAWENGSSSVTPEQDPAHLAIAKLGAGTQFGTDFGHWLADTRAVNVSAAITDAGRVHDDCAAAGVPGVLAQGTTGPAPVAPAQGTTAPAQTTAPAAPAAPVFHVQTLLTLNGNGTEDTASFTVPGDGSGNWKIIWTYNEGSFGQSVNFIVNSEDYKANVNKLGTGGQGTEYVYGDSGTHHLSVSSEGNWTLQVVTAP